MAKLQRLEERILFEPTAQSQGFRAPTAPDLITPLRQSQEAKKEEQRAHAEARQTEMRRQGEFLKYQEIAEEYQLKGLLALTDAGKTLLEEGYKAYEKSEDAAGTAAFYNAIDERNAAVARYQNNEAQLSALDTGAEELALEAQKNGASNSVVRRYQDLWGRRKKAFANAAIKYATTNYESHLTTRLMDDEEIRLPNGNTIRLNNPNKTDAEYALVKQHLREEWMQITGLGQMGADQVAAEAFPTFGQVEAKLDQKFAKESADNASIQIQAEETELLDTNLENGNPYALSHYLNRVATTTVNGKPIGFAGAWRRLRETIVARAAEGEDVGPLIAQLQALPIPGDKKGRTYGQLYNKTQFNKIIDEVDSAAVRDFNQEQAQGEIITNNLIQQWMEEVGNEYTDEQIFAFEEKLKTMRAERGLYGPIRQLDKLKNDASFNLSAAERAEQIAELQLKQMQGLLKVDEVNTYPEEIAKQFRNYAIQQENAHNTSVKPVLKQVEQAVKGLDGVKLIGGQEMSGRAGMIAEHYKRVLNIRVQEILRADPSIDINSAAEQAYKEFELQLEKDTTDKSHPFYLDQDPEGGFNGFENYNKAKTTGGITVQINNELNRINSAAKSKPSTYLDTPGLFGSKADFEGWAANYGQPGWRVPTTIARWAAYHQISPLEIMNRQMIAHDLPPLPNVEQILEQRKQVTPEYRRMLDKLFSGTASMNQYNRLTGGPVPVRSSIASVVPSSREARFRKGIINEESGGSYTVVNPDSGAIGIGQVMPSNVGPWTRKYYGRALSPQAFRYNPAAQDAVLNGRFKDMLDEQFKAGYQGEEAIRRAASVWYSGKAHLYNHTAPQYYNGRRYKSIADYTKGVWRTYNSIK